MSWIKPLNWKSTQPAPRRVFHAASEKIAAVIPFAADIAPWAILAVMFAPCPLISEYPALKRPEDWARFLRLSRAMLEQLTAVQEPPESDKVF